MANPVQLIFDATPGASSDSYTVPPGLDLVLASVNVQVDGSAAGADYLPVLEILSQQGFIMMQARPDEAFAAGDTGRVSYAPF